MSPVFGASFGGDGGGVPCRGGPLSVRYQPGSQHFEVESRRPFVTLFTVSFMTGGGCADGAGWTDTGHPEM